MANPIVGSFHRWRLIANQSYPVKKQAQPPVVDDQTGQQPPANHPTTTDSAFSGLNGRFPQGTEVAAGVGVMVGNGSGEEVSVADGCKEVGVSEGLKMRFTSSLPGLDLTQGLGDPGQTKNDCCSQHDRCSRRNIKIVTGI